MQFLMLLKLHDSKTCYHTFEVDGGNQSLNEQWHVFMMGCGANLFLVS